MYLGIDVGTSEVKAMLLNEQHKVLALAGAPLEVSRPHPGHSEQDPYSWWAATCMALRQLRHLHPTEFKSVKAIGLSGQMHGAVLLDKSNRVLRPAILWNDTRSTRECEQMMAEMPQAAALAGSLIMPGFTAPKLRWVARHEPEVFDQVVKVLLPKDYIRLMLTGEHITDVSDASGTGWLDVAQRTWSPDLLKLSGLDLSHMPQLVEGNAPAGRILPYVATDLGLPAGLTVAGGAGDNASSAVGMGAVQSGDGFLSLGTSGVVFLVSPRFAPQVASATHAFCHAVPGQWHQMSVMLSAASCLQWAKHSLGAASESELENQASQLHAEDRAAAPLFLPYLGGERTPHNQANLRASFHGIGNGTSQAAMAYSVFEGVTFGLLDGLAALRQGGSEVRRLSLVGGGARSAMWAQQLASALNVEIVTHQESTAGGALGAARLAWMAHGGTLADVCVQPAVAQSYHPNDAERAMLLPRYARFKALYAALQTVQSVI